MTMPTLDHVAGRRVIAPIPAIVLPPSAIAAPTAQHEPTTARNSSGGVPALIVLGRDDADRPHASWFTADEMPLATRAAGLMEMVTLQVEGDVLARIAAKLPHGRVFASGKAFVPFVKGAVYDDLVAHLPEGV